MADRRGPRIGASIRLLLVEQDHRDSVRVRHMLPRGPGSTFEIEPVTQVEDALARIQEESFDVLLLDLNTQEDQGIDTLLRARIATASLPIVVMSDDDDETLALRALRLGAQDYLVKSEASRHLVTRTLLHAIERHRLLRDLTETRQREHFLATHDPLTELPNRFALEEFLSRSIALAQRREDSVAVIFIDLDGFKAVNDTLGHAAGDELLRQAANRLLQRVRRSDLVARLGGDEFIVALPDVEGVEGALRSARLLAESLIQPYAIAGRECWMTASLGVALCPHDTSDADTLVRYSDLAMYEAKRRGPNQIRLYQQVEDSGLCDRFQLVNGLREAISRDELVLHYQPQIDVAAGVVVSAEALPRWRHPAAGWVSPREFIPVAEQSGMAGPIGDWVLRTACEHAMGWSEDLRVAVNVSGAQLADADFAERVAKTLRDTQLPPWRLELEITEPSAAGKNQGIRQTIARLREMGLRIVLDDFGTGTSSLTLLRTLALDGLKLDESLVHGSANDQRDEVIIGGLVRMARALGVALVAEGVETRDQLRLLYQQGCQRMQGYLLAKPTQAQDFPALLEAAPWDQELECLED